MVILRPTRKLQALVPPAAEPTAPSDTALGDWYLNRLVVDRQPLLLLVSSRSLLSILIPARDARTLPARLPDVVRGRLRRFGVSAPLIEAEARAMTPVTVAKTIDRSVLGVMVNFAKDIPYYLEIDGWDENTLPDVEAKLAETPCLRLGALRNA
jgi:hypothetical protein